MAKINFVKHIQLNENLTIVTFGSRCRAKSNLLKLLRSTSLTLCRRASSLPDRWCTSCPQRSVSCTHFTWGTKRTTTLAARLSLVSSCQLRNETFLFTAVRITVNHYLLCNLWKTNVLKSIVFNKMFKFLKRFKA